MMERYIIGSTPTDQVLSFSLALQPVVHYDYTAACAEGDRLAEAFPGKIFVLFRATMTFETEANPVKRIGLL